MWSPFSLLSLAALLIPSQALYFYIDGPTQKCFFEELPKDTLVVGTFSATQWNDQSRAYGTNPDMGIFITVDEVFDNDHRVVSQRGSHTGKFTFSAADSGLHRLCFTPTNVPATTGLLFSGSSAGGIKIDLDLAIGETSAIESSDKDKLGEVVQKVRDLNARLLDIRREQIFQREREAEFRDQSEAVNGRVVRWTLIQLAVLGVTCAWQLSYLRAFFIKQKVV
ncbi:emp24p/erv25p-related protein [Friedmanniomyces endolithicus]|uniref:Emp24p/erv25p-related protein n=1 Tax=Friedmanniomyces endolithicus TaxID=329885 RepID=A0AAN6L4M9_9PEZI|nr:emp24p/erv25p-related protein [Friedmanniomyces endolithicus]KAK0797562.1 emp24p/erv25p-related protein [Friedmanniomyces endolithicus]KAK0819942.1 emp24p/erv25p-related protein [Friedmanniomyces endolithicus]KAK0864444.1 emp24p/erv25p-related protein [Friedmanniomyces endolithicus]KAK0885364.1 emp24p/erv25p-related protein [Friedmanniomyces endolithicus]